MGAYFDTRSFGKVLSLVAADGQLFAFVQIVSSADNHDSACHGS